MKKLLLFATAIVFSFSLNAQNGKAIKRAAVSGPVKFKALKSKPILDNKEQFGASFFNAPAPLTMAKDINAINKVFLNLVIQLYP